MTPPRPNSQWSQSTRLTTAGDNRLHLAGLSDSDIYDTLQRLKVHLDPWCNLPEAFTNDC